MIPTNARGIQKINRVPTRNPIDQIPPLDFFGKKVVEDICSFKDRHEKL